MLIGKGDRNVPLIYFSVMATPHSTKMAIVNSENNEEGWCKVTLDLHEITMVRPSINDDLEYQNTHVYFKNGLDIIIEDDYDEFIKQWLDEIVTCSQSKKPRSI